MGKGTSMRHRDAKTAEKKTVTLISEDAQGAHTKDAEDGVD